MKEEKTILVADDNSENRSILERFLLHLGYQVTLCKNGREAWDRITDKSYEMIFSDVNMPEINGMELLQNLRQKGDQTPMVMITGFPSITLAVESMKKGATDFVTKPFQLEHIEHIVTRIQKEKSLEQTHRDLEEALRSKKQIEGLNKKLEKKVEELSIMYSISEISTYTENMEELFDRIIELTSTITNGKEISIMLLDQETNMLVPKRLHGNSKHLEPIPFGEGAVGKVAREKRSLLIPAERREGLSIPHKTEGTFLSIPMMIKDEVFGLLNITKPSLFLDKELHLLQNMISKFTMTLENHALYESIYENLINTLRSLVMAVEAKDLYTKDHSQRVMDLSILIANELGCSRAELETLRFAGYIHDIGKIGIQDIVLLKPGRLNEMEQKIIMTHPVIGENILKPLKFLKNEQKIVRHHHERFDGRGYPDGLHGEESPFLARILSVADTYDAITSTRSYRTSKGHDHAIAEIKRCRSKQFDPNITDAFLSCLSSYGKDEMADCIPWQLVSRKVQGII
jgi:putative nucleotidyltransferase with HDIG domain